MSYDVIGVRTDGSVIRNLKRWKKAPNDMQLFEWGHKRACAVVIRFWPSKKGWMPLDIREAAIIVGARYGRQSGAMYTRLVRGHRGRVFPSEDAAVMYALSMLQTQHAFDFARQ